MKKTILSLAVFAGLLPSLKTAAQEMPDISAPQKPESVRSFIGITGGVSIPTGNFAKGDYFNNNSGYAGTGGNVGLTGVYFFGHSRFGISASVTYQGFSFKGAQSLADGYKDGYSLDSTTLYNKGNNYAINALIGPYYSIPVAHHFSIDVRAMAGFTSVHRIGYQVAFEDAAYDIVQNESTAGSFGWQAGIAPKYDFCKHAGLMLNIDYFSSDPKFNISYSSFHPANNAEEPGISNEPINKTLPTTYHQPLQGINTNLTLYWKF